MPLPLATRSARLTLVLSSVLACSAAQAAPDASSTRTGVHLGLESFTWKERDANDNQLLKETGPRLSAAITVDNLMRQGEGGLFALELRGYYGEVDYDGEAQGGVAIQSETEYAGAALEGRIGYRFPLNWSPLAIDPMAGVGAELWDRDIQDSGYTDGNNWVKVQGYRETYQIVFAKAGLALTEMTDDQWTGRLEVGTKYPLITDEEVSILSENLQPGRKTSLYAQYEAFRKGKKSEIGLTLYYESYRFGKSPQVEPGFFQPESDMDVIGLRFGYYL
ncbi:MAG TPA: outer membrane beta-barrel protein [Gammaproteobacteria bacterium]|nr:outer membrane beta-barrel protein [Gammaproteobacteria bacterium]